MLGNIWNKCENIVILRGSIIISSIFNSFLKIYPIFQYPFSSETERNSTEKQNSFSLRKYFRINENMNSLRYNSARLYQIKFLSPNLTIWIKRSLIFHISTRKEKKIHFFHSYCKERQNQLTGRIVEQTRAGCGHRSRVWIEIESRGSIW